MMIKIKCANHQCTNPDTSKLFEWDETQDLDKTTEVVDEGTPNAISYLVTCPFCLEKNKIWVKGKKPNMILWFAEKILQYFTYFLPRL